MSIPTHSHQSNNLPAPISAPAPDAGNILSFESPSTIDWGEDSLAEIMAKTAYHFRNIPILVIASPWLIAQGYETWDYIARYTVEHLRGDHYRVTGWVYEYVSSNPDRWLKYPIASIEVATPGIWLSTVSPLPRPEEPQPKLEFIS